MDNLSRGCRELSRKEAHVKLELRRNRGHGGKVDNSVLSWLDSVETLRDRFNNLESQIDNIGCCCYSRLKLWRSVAKLTNEVKSLQRKSSFMQLFNDTKGADGLAGEMASQTLVGKLAQKVSNQIWGYLRDSVTGTMCLYGDGGVGKTIIMTNITNQLRNGIEIFDQIIWVTFSENLNLKRIQEDIARQLGINLPINEDEDIMGPRGASSTISDHMKKIKTWLFILDDVWEPTSLEWIGIPRPKPGDGCKIVITSRFYHHSVDRLINLGRLSETEAWGLFVSKTGDQVLLPSIKHFAEKIVYNCEGLPIAIIIVGRAMRDKVHVSCWRDALEDLKFAQREIAAKGMNKVFGHLGFGYNQLKNEQVQKCFLYCAIFPEDYKFEPREIIGYWMAENLLHNNNGIITSRNEGSEILRELKDANMLQMFLEGGNERLTMHDLVRDLAITIMTEKLGFLIKAGLLLSDFPHYSEHRKAKNISLIRNRLERLDCAPSCPNLSTLFLTDNPLSHISTWFFGYMHELEVLDMSYSGITQLPLTITFLSKLRVLVLQYCTSLEEIPSLTNLKALQVLNLRGTLIKVLPHGIEELVNLKTLDLSETLRLSGIQIGLVSSLSNLEELHLQGSLLCRMGSSIVANFSKEIKCLKQLAILTLSAVGFEDHLDTILYLQDQNLKIFSINVYRSTQDYAEDV